MSWYLHQGWKRLGRPPYQQAKGDFSFPSHRKDQEGRYGAQLYGVLESKINTQAASFHGMEAQLQQLLAKVDVVQLQQRTLEDDVKYQKMVGMEMANSLWAKIADRMDKVEADQQALRRLHAGAYSQPVRQTEACHAEATRGLQQQPLNLGSQRDDHIAVLEQQVKDLIEVRDRQQQQQQQQHAAAEAELAALRDGRAESRMQLDAFAAQAQALAAGLQQQQQREEQLRQVVALEGRVKKMEASLRQQQQQQQEQQQQQQQAAASSIDVPLTALDKRVCTLEASLAKQQQMQAAMEALQGKVHDMQRQHSVSADTASSMSALYKQVKECERFLEMQKNMQDVQNSEVGVQLAALERQLRELQQQQQQQQHPQQHPQHQFKTGSVPSAAGGKSTTLCLLEKQVSSLEGQLQQVAREQQELRQGQGGKGSDVKELKNWHAVLAERVRDLEQLQRAHNKEQLQLQQQQQQQQQDLMKDTVNQAALGQSMRSLERALQQQEQKHSHAAAEAKLSIAALEQQLRDTRAQESLPGLDDTAISKRRAQELSTRVEQLQARCEQTARQTLELERRDNTKAIKAMQDSLAEATARLAALEGPGGVINKSHSGPEIQKLEAFILECVDQKGAMIQQMQKTLDVIVADMNKLAHAIPNGECLLPGGQALASPGSANLQPFILSSVMKNLMNYDAAVERFAKKSSLKEAHEKARKNEDLIVKVMRELDRKMQEKVDMLGKALLRTAQQVDVLHNKMREQTVDKQPGTASSLADIKSLGRSDSIKSLLTSSQAKGEESAMDRAMRVMGKQGEDSRSKRGSCSGSTSGSLSALQYFQQTSSGYGRASNWDDGRSVRSCDFSDGFSSSQFDLKSER